MLCLVLEIQACRKLEAQNDTLRRQLDKMAALIAENQRLSNLLAQANTSLPRTNVPTDGRLEELARLREQAKELHADVNNAERLRADTIAARVALDEARKARRASRQASLPDPGGSSDAPFEIVSAQYGTDKTNMDVTAELNDRIHGGNLKAIASNNLNGDPDFGTVKNLTLIYRYGGVLMTNQFREGDMIILPPPVE